jgi:trk system potassium uptake protein TrkH
MVLGTLLLKLPASTYGGISWVDAFFISVSAASVTGLSSVEFTDTFTRFGDTVIMLLVQVGGLGVMTFTTLGALLVGRRVLGAVVLAAAFVWSGLGYGESLFQAVFHSITAFCNSGFVALPGADLSPYAGNAAINLTFVALIILGGLGFPVLVNLYHYREMRRLTLHSKLVIVTSAVLILVGVLSVALLEWTNPATLGGNPLGTRLWMSLFQGVTPRTAGFSTVDYSQMYESTLFVQIGLMFIGTAPASTGGGIKVTTIALLVLVLLAQVRGQEEISAFGRQVPRGLVQKALAVLSISALVVIAATLAIMVSDGLRLVPAIFEITSAFGTVGLSMQVSPELSTFAKLVVIGVMFFGRVGSITLVLALSARKPRGYVYPQEDIAVG